MSSLQSLRTPRARQPSCLHFAAQLRSFGHDGPITLIGDEASVPYQRPPLSKAWLSGETGADRLALRPLEFYLRQAIDFRPRTRVIGLDRVTKRVFLDRAEPVEYGVLILATGARARKLSVPGANPADVLVLRTTDDAEALKARLRPGVRLAVVGGGYVGLEVAATARKLGCSVVVLEQETRLLARVAALELSSFIQQYHESKGVQIEIGARVAAFQEYQGRLAAITLSDGRDLACDVAVVGVGAIPNDALAREARLKVNGGVVVDLEARTSDPSIFAIGDVTLRPMPLYGRMFRMESVPNALEQARQAASAIVGRPAPAGEVPWQWSDQYDLKLQIAGYPFSADRRIVRGDPATARFAVFHLNGDRIQSVEAINAPAEFLAGKQLIGGRIPVDPDRLADPATSMKEVGLLQA